MSPDRLLSPLVALLLLSFTGSAGQTRRLTFDERVEAQRAIERVYHAHLTGPARPFDEVVSKATLERKVRDYLKQSEALERYWSTPVTAEALQAELARIAGSTRLPERLEEIYRALDGDSLVIQECFVRASLVDRLTRSFFAADERIHGAARREAEELRGRLERGELAPGDADPHRTVVQLRRAKPGAGRRTGSLDLRSRRGSGDEALVLELDPAEYREFRGRAPAGTGTVGPLREERDAFVFSAILAEQGGSATLATWSLPKRSWDTWWGEMEGRLDASVVEPVASEQVDLAVQAAPAASLREEGPIALSEAKAASGPGLAPCPPGPIWEGIPLAGPPGRRTGQTAVWTGSRMVVWGGYDGSYLASGGLYDPLTDTWKPTSTTGAPAARYAHTAVWTGTSMLVWGGADGTYRNDGGRYDPLSDTWSSISTTGAPTGRYAHTAVWTGTEMIVWGGANSTLLTTGGRYEPVTDTWGTLSTIGAPTGRVGHTAVWTAQRMIVWGGSDGTYLKDGALYNPFDDTWSAIQQAGSGVPAGRYAHTAVWTGSRMIVWGGRGSGNVPVNTGGRYDPAGNTWSTTSTVNAPAPRDGHAGIWTGSMMVIWGGSGLASGGRYDPTADTWTATSTVNAPSGRYNPTGVWAQDRLIVWGGDDSTGYLATGGRYDPGANTWTPTSSPPGREGSLLALRHTAVWTGSLAIVWDGTGVSGGRALSTGSRYDPLIDAWRPISTAGAPVGRVSHTAIWTGRKMIVWGGSDLVAVLGSGGAYDPVSDLWSAISSTNAPSARDFHTAVWTGSRMVIWGGLESGGIPTGTGGRYDPSTDAWSPTIMTGAPSARTRHTAVWTGQRMIVWGGDDGQVATGTGGAYDPAADAWETVTTLNAPEARSTHAAVWTGRKMIVWGGGSLTSGGLYDPASGSWAPTSTTNAPSPRNAPVTLWTGRAMLVWGGNLLGPGTNTGSLYDPAADTWSPLPVAGAPLSSAADHAVWTGSEMLLWQGIPGTMSRLAIVPDDEDGDGLSVCDGDCDDRDASVRPGAREVCDNRDNDCNGVVDSMTTDCGTTACPRLGFCDGGLDSCQPTTCGFAVTRPAPGTVLPAGGIPPQPRIEWDKAGYDQFKVYIHWDPALSKKKSINSGSAYLTTASFTPSLLKWNKAYLQALKTGRNLHVRVLGRSSVTKAKSYTDAVELKVSLVSITSPSSGEIYSTQEETIDLGGSAATLVPLSRIGWSTDRGAHIGDATGTFSWTAARIPLECGANRISVTATNTSGVSGDDTLVVFHDSARCTDTVPPAIEITSPVSSPTHTTTVSPVALAGTAADNFALTRVEWINDRGGMGTATGTAAWSIPAVPLQCGINRISVTAEDDAGNHRTDTLSVSYAPSTCTPPAVTITGPTSAAAHLTYVSPLALSGTASDNLGLSGVTWSNARNGANGTASGTTSWSTPGVPLACGANVVSVTATDTDGNTGSDAISVFYQCVDNVSPQITISSPTSNPTLTTGANPLTLGGTASDNVSVQSVTWANSRGGSGAAGGTASWTASGIALKCGSNLLTVTAHDPSGNTGTDTLDATYTESVAPSVTITSPTSSSTYATSTISTLSLGGTSSDNFALQDVTWTRSYGGGVVASGTASGTSSWSASIPLQCGTNLLTVTAHDTCGNASSSDTLTVVPELTYTSNSAAVFNAYCIGCHSATSTTRVNLTTYASVSANRSLVRSKLSPGGTMRAYAGDANADLVIRWIDQCAPQ